MKKIYILIVTAFTFVIASSGYTANTEEEVSMDSSSTMEMSEDMSGMMGGMHHKGVEHRGMMGHHMMHSGVSPVTIMVQPGMMPMMGHGMMHRGEKGGHKGGEMGRGKMMKEHMERMEQRLKNIEALLSELVELQKKGE
ncbi:MAG: hypothetical protein OEQ39_07970 [Gammaproteobacteria bacterium]|nr:hypothetical protein [Gammaproteobacteria bacterium]MDH3464664.1 hypothetical protein [Gammaproteobacteria bacterium]